jgi:hypothetical protein
MPVTFSHQKDQRLRNGVTVAARTIVHLIDDIDGGEADETVSFALDGVEYDIDLSSGNADSLRKALGEFVTSGRRTSGRKVRGGAVGATTKVSAGGDKAQNQAIREWARRQGHTVSDRGRIPSELIAQFQQAHGA